MDYQSDVNIDISAVVASIGVKSISLCPGAPGRLSLGKGGEERMDFLEFQGFFGHFLGISIFFGVFSEYCIGSLGLVFGWLEDA